MANSEKLGELRKRRALRIRKKVIGSAQRPRLSVRRSLHNIYAQLIDDTAQRTIAQVGSVSKIVVDRIPKEGANKSSISKIVGEVIAELALEKGVKAIVFDRKGYAYHGRVKALADGARSKGLQF